MIFMGFFLFNNIILNHLFITLMLIAMAVHIQIRNLTFSVNYCNSGVYN
jgi:hypothetical protein